jgi:hypothetical protein
MRGFFLRWGVTTHMTNPLSPQWLTGDSHPRITESTFSAMKIALHGPLYRLSCRSEDLPALRYRALAQVWDRLSDTSEPTRRVVRAAMGMLRRKY